jgi:hypothetical protein
VLQRAKGLPALWDRLALSMRRSKWVRRTAVVVALGQRRLSRSAVSRIRLITRAALLGGATQMKRLLGVHAEDLFGVDPADAQVFGQCPRDDGVGAVGQFDDDQRVQLVLLQVGGNFVVIDIAVFQILEP